MTTIKERQGDEEYLDPYSIFKFAMNSPVTRDRYTIRLDRFFSSIGIEGIDIEERCRVFDQNARKDSSWAFRNMDSFLQVQKERVDRRDYRVADKSLGKGPLDKSKVVNSPGMITKTMASYF